MIRPLPPYNRRMFPYRASIERRIRVKPNPRDASGARIDSHAPAEPETPCNILSASVETVPDLEVRTEKINTVIFFPNDVKLVEEDRITVIDENGEPWGKPLLVKRYQRIGLWALRRWQADCVAT